MVTAGVPDQGGGLTAGVTIRVPESLARAATAVAAGEGLYVSEWIRNLVAAEVARREGRVTVSRADLELVLHGKDEDRAAWRRLREAASS